MVARSLASGGAYIQTEDNSLSSAAADGTIKPLTWSPTPITLSSGRQLLGTVGYAQEDAAVLDTASSSVHPLTQLSGYPARLSLYQDQAGALWAVGIGRSSGDCPVLTSSDEGATWASLSSMACSTGTNVSLAVLPTSYVVAAGPAPDTGLTTSTPTASPGRTTLMAASAAGTTTGTSSVPNDPDVIDAHVIKVGSSAGLVTARLSGGTTVAPIDPDTGSVGSATAVNASDLMQDPRTSIAWTIVGNTVHEYSTSLTSGVAVTVR